MLALASQTRPTASILLITLLGLVGALTFGLLAAGAPIVAAIVVIMGTVSLVSIFYPNVATQAFIIVLYTNAAVIANRFHDIPFIISASFPLLLAIPFVFIVILQRKKIIFTPVFMMIAGLVLVQVVGTLFSIDVATAFGNLTNFITEAFVIYFLLTNVIRDQRALRVALLMVFIATIVLAIFPIIQFVTNDTTQNFAGFAQVEDEPGFSTTDSLITDSRQARYSGAIGEKNRYAQVMFMLMMISLPHIWRDESRLWRWLALVTTGLAAFAGVLAFSRGAAVGLAIAFLVAVLVRMISKRQAAVMILGALLFLTLFPQYTFRLMSLQSVTVLLGFQTEAAADEPDGAMEGRLTQMLAAFIVYVEHPIVGVGPEMFKYYAEDVGNQLGIRRLDGTRRSHSLYFDLLSNTGTLGTVLFFGIVFTILRQMLRTTREWQGENAFISNAAAGFFLAVVLYLATGLFLHFAYIRYFWTTIALASTVYLVAEHLKTQRQLGKVKNG